MAGFNKDSIKKNTIDFEDLDGLGDIDTDIDDLDDLDEIPSKPSLSNGSKKVVKRPISNKKEENNKTVIYIACGVCALLLVVGGVLIYSSINSKKNEVIEPPPAPKPVIEESVNTGIPNLYGDGKPQNHSQVYDPDLILKDLNGVTIPPDYTIVSTEEVTDFINYEKFRAVTGDGMEFYWLEAQYKGVPCKVQVPYSIYSKLDNRGITVVDIEVLKLENDSEVVSYMRVRKDAKELLDKNR